MVEKYRKAVIAVIYNFNGKVLIGNSPRDGGYKFPQGGMDEGEIPIETLFREVKEELNLDLKLEDIVFESKKVVKYNYDKSKLDKNHPYYHYKGQEQYVFKIKYRKDMIISPQDDEFERMIWINPKKDLDKYNFSHRFDAYKKALKICGLL